MFKGWFSCITFLNGRQICVLSNWPLKPDLITMIYVPDVLKYSRNKAMKVDLHMSSMNILFFTFLIKWPVFPSGVMLKATFMMIHTQWREALVVGSHDDVICKSNWEREEANQGPEIMPEKVTFMPCWMSRRGSGNHSGNPQVLIFCYSFYLYQSFFTSKVRIMPASTKLCNNDADEF